MPAISATSDELRYIDLLTKHLAVPAGLAHAFEIQGFKLRCFDDIETLVEAMKVKKAAALLVESSLVTLVCATLDALSKQVPAGANTIIIGIGHSGAGERLQALLNGARECLDHLDDPNLATRVVELIEHDHEDSYRILIIDDDTSTRIYLRAVLEQAGMRVQECADPHTALEHINSFRPDLLLVDLYMPGMDGVSLTMQIRQQPALATLPIVFLSIKHDDETRFRAIQAGGDDFLPKPARPRILIATIRNRIKRVRSVAHPMSIATNTAMRSGQLRRGDFLVQLGEALRNPIGSWEVLISVKIDQADTLKEKLGFAGAFELEQSVAHRLAGEMRKDDAYTLWLEFGFGILVHRNSSEELIEFAERLCLTVAKKPFNVLGQNISLTISVGLALPPPAAGPSDPDRWFAAAFAAQAIAHRLGGNRYDGILNRKHGAMPAERVLMIREWVKEAAAGQNIIVEFQPMLPLREGLGGQYALLTKLRDFRAPLAGVTREEYLIAAREAGVLSMIERAGLLRAFEAIEEQQVRNCNTRILVPMDLDSFDEAQLTWITAALRHRKAQLTGLVIELDAGLLLARPTLDSMLQRFKDYGIAISLADDSGSLTRVEQLLNLPVDMLRLPFDAVDGIPPKAFVELMEPWHANGRTVIVDHVESFYAISQLLALGIGYLQGDALAAPSPRLDYDFTQLGA